MHRLAEELEKNSALISQIELLCRGVLTKDTKQAVHNLAQYFYYYACFVEENEDAKGKTDCILSIGLFCSVLLLIFLLFYLVLFFS